MQKRECNFCHTDIEGKDGVSFGPYDLCVECVKLTRRAICLKCHGTGKIRIVDNEATDAQGTCGENRTQYKTVNCGKCM